MGLFKKRVDMNTWREVYLAAGQAIVKSNLPPSDTDVLLSITSAASDVAGRVYKVHEDYFRKLGKLTFERAIPFVKVFAIAMTSRWVRQMCSRDPSLDRRRMWAHLTTAVLRVFGDSSQECYEEAWLLDVQFNHDRILMEQGKGSASWNEQWLLLCLAARALGAPFTWKLSSPPIPFASASDLHKQAPGWDPPAGLNLLDISRLLDITDELLAAEAGMAAAFKALQQKRQ
jgi:hypothetical protein